ncbi:MAG: ABC transporter ATP-binding protein [Alphaproteobacteria bacterium]
MSDISLKAIEKYFGDNYVIRKLDLEIQHKEFVVLLGPSGCGKTTTLRAIAGLESIDSGEILIEGKPVQDLPAGDRDIAFVFQLFALYPHLSAYDNIAFPLRATRQSASKVDRQVREVAKTLQIEHLLKQMPSGLSGGDMQRVAIGRALVRRPKALLMDEPIGALDAKLREDMRSELKRLHVENEATTVYVTHDQVEALSLADRIAIMNDGVLQQVGTPDEVYLNPANLFVAQFVGSPVMNVTDVDVRSEAGTTKIEFRGSGVVFDFSPELENRVSRAGPGGKSLKLGVRPEGIQVQLAETSGFQPVEAHIIEPLGAYDIVDLRIGDQFMRARTASGYVSRPGDMVWAKLDEAQTHFFDAESGESLGIRLGD